jgi:hypothetical protein
MLKIRQVDASKNLVLIALRNEFQKINALGKASARSRSRSRYGKEGQCKALHGKTSHGMEIQGKAWHGMERQGKAWYGIPLPHTWLTSLSTWCALL